VACGIFAFLAMLVAMLLAKPRFASTAVMIIPQGNPGAAALTAQLGATAANLDLLGGGYELYADILKSRTVADRLIGDYNLMKEYGAKNMAQAEMVLGGATQVEAQRDGVLRVTVQDADPQRAADLANDYLHQLDALNSKLALTAVGQERAFLEREMVAEKDRLADAEVALEQNQENLTGLPPEAEATADLSALETTRVQLRAAEVRLDALLTSETDANPEVIRTRSEIAGLASQLNALQHGTSSAETGTPTKAVPAQALQYTRRLRDVKFHEALFEALEKEYEAAKEQEAKSPSIVEVLDPAVPALHKAWPPRTTYCLIAGAAGLVAGVLLVTLQALVLAYTGAPQNREKLQALELRYRNMFRRSA
jgi:tyrosine-protein kinase Etk/Wzc